MFPSRNGVIIYLNEFPKNEGSGGAAIAAVLKSLLIAFQSDEGTKVVLVLYT